MARYSGISAVQLTLGGTTVDLENVEAIEVTEAEGRTVTQPGDNDTGETFADVVDRQRRWNVRLRDLSAADEVFQGRWDSLRFTVAGLAAAADRTYTLAGGGVIVERIEHDHRHGRASSAAIHGRALFDESTDPLSVS